jgi:hypothetical protein
MEWRRAPQFVDLADGLRDLDLALCGDLLQYQRHRKQRRKIARSDRLAGSRMQDRRQRLREVGRDVVPRPWDPLLGQKIFDAVVHARAPLLVP